MNVTPSRFSALTDEETKLYSLEWRNGIGSNTIQSVKWLSYPVGLTFTESDVTGTITSVKISGGIQNTKYRVRCIVTLNETGEKLEAKGGDDQPGIPIEVLGFPVHSGGLGTLRDDYGRGAY